MLRNISLVVAIAAFVACNGGDVGPEGGLVGGPCRDSRDCAERCVGGGDFPGGTCTIDCRDDGDCPDGTWCIDKAGGVCLLGCGHHDDCRGGYECKWRDRKGARGDERVCID
jgi:hypothetical protein